MYRTEFDTHLNAILSSLHKQLQLSSLLTVELYTEQQKKIHTHVHTYTTIHATRELRHRTLHVHCDVLLWRSVSIVIIDRMMTRYHLYYFPNIAIPISQFQGGTYYFPRDRTMPSFKFSSGTIFSHMMYSRLINEENSWDEGFWITTSQPRTSLQKSTRRLNKPGSICSAMTPLTCLLAAKRWEFYLYIIMH